MFEHVKTVVLNLFIAIFTERFEILWVLNFYSFQFDLENLQFFNDAIRKKVKKHCVLIISYFVKSLRKQTLQNIEKV